MKTIIEPFRMKVVEPIRMTTRADRERLIEAAHFNLFGLHSDDAVFTQGHADFLVEVFEEIARKKARLRGYRIVREPRLMRRFTARFARL